MKALVQRLGENPMVSLCNKVLFSKYLYIRIIKNYWRSQFFAQDREFLLSLHIEQNGNLAREHKINITCRFEGDHSMLRNKEKTQNIVKFSTAVRKNIVPHKARFLLGALLLLGGIQHANEEPLPP
jgi:hypothetical protein